MFALKVEHVAGICFSFFSTFFLSLPLSLSLSLSHSDAYPTHHPSLSLPLSLTLPASTNLIPDLIKYVKNPLPPSAKKFVSKNQLFKFPPQLSLSLSLSLIRDKIFTPSKSLFYPNSPFSLLFSISVSDPTYVSLLLSFVYFSPYTYLIVLIPFVSFSQSLFSFSAQLSLSPLFSTCLHTHTKSAFFFILSSIHSKPLCLPLYLSFLVNFLSHCLTGCLIFLFYSLSLFILPFFFLSVANLINIFTTVNYNSGVKIYANLQSVQLYSRKLQSQSAL